MRLKICSQLNQVPGTVLSLLLTFVKVTHFELVYGEMMKLCLKVDFPAKYLSGRGNIELLHEVVDDEDGHDDREEERVHEADDEDGSEHGQDLKEQRPQDLGDGHVDDVNVLGKSENRSCDF